MVDVYGEMGPHDLLEIRLAARAAWFEKAGLDTPAESSYIGDGGIALVPFAREICPVVKAADDAPAVGQAYIIIDPPGGLLEVSTPRIEAQVDERKKRKRRRRRRGRERARKASLEAGADVQSVDSEQ